MAVALNGQAKAAIFLLSLDEERALRIIEHLDEEELKILRKAIDGLGNISVEILEQVYAEFSESYKSGLASISGGKTYLEELVAKARGEDEAKRLFAPPLPPAPPPPPPAPPKKPFESFANADPKTISIAMRGEHPQVVAAILAYLDPSLSCQILAERPVEDQAKIIKRIASLKKVPIAAIRDVEEAISAFGIEIGELGEIDGVSSAATIMNSMVGENATDVLDRLGEESPEEAESIRRAMFTFEDLVDADIRGLQQMLREVQSDTLLIALKTASDAVRKKIFSCMSQRAAGMLQEELEVMAPVRLAEVEAAQRDIVDLAMRLMSEGKLSVQGRGEKMV